MRNNSDFDDETHGIIKTEADIYFEIAEALTENNGLFTVENIKNQKDSTRAHVTSAIYGYVAESYLKFIITQFGEKPPKGHNLEKIYRKIQTEECVEFLKATFVKYFEGINEFLEKGLSQILKKVKNNFVDHRYIAEKVQSGYYFDIRFDYNYLFCGYLKEMTDEWIKVKYRVD